MTSRGHAPWQSLPSAEFEGVLHPVFEEDEWKLIAVGGLLGMWVGIFQALFVFGQLELLFAYFPKRPFQHFVIIWRSCNYFT